MSNVNLSDNIATLIMNTNVTGLSEILTNPLGDFESTKVPIHKYYLQGKRYDSWP